MGNYDLWRIEKVLRDLVDACQYVYLGPVRRRVRAEAVVVPALSEIKAILAESHSNSAKCLDCGQVADILDGRCLPCFEAWAARR